MSEEEQFEGQSFQEESFNSGESQQDEFVNDFLKNVAPEHRGFVEPYYKDWGAKVTQRFQKINEDLRPWKDLGIEPQQVQQLRQQMEFIDQNPQEVYARLHTYLQQTGQLPNQNPQQAPVVQPTLVDRFGSEVPPEILQELEALRTKTALTEGVVTQLGNHFLQQRQAEQHRQEQAMMDARLNELRAKNEAANIPFNDQFIVALTSQGIAPEVAVAKWNEMITGAARQYSQPANVPKIISSTGQAPVASAPKLGEVSSNDIKDIVASLMRQSQSS